jgi:hypothetical protein
VGGLFKMGRGSDGLFEMVVAPTGLFEMVVAPHSLVVRLAVIIAQVRAVGKLLARGAVHVQCVRHEASARQEEADREGGRDADADEGGRGAPAETGG